MNNNQQTLWRSNLSPLGFIFWREVRLKDNKNNYEIYTVTDNEGNYLYVGSGRSGRHRHCSSGKSSVKELNEMYFKNIPFRVEVIYSGLDKEKSLYIEHEMIYELDPKFNKVCQRKVLDDVDFNNYKAVLKYTKKRKPDIHLLKLVLLYTQEPDIISIVENKLNRLESLGCVA